jgi:very-short-patch-repair endonuclease
VGHEKLSAKGEWMAAVLACGDGAVLSHRSAAELLGMLAQRDGPIHVTVPTSSGRANQDGIHLHRSPSLPRAATGTCDGIPVTSPVRTIVNLRRVANEDEVRRAIRQAEFQNYDIEAAFAEWPAPTRSALERRFHTMCRKHGLPEPEVNAMVGPYEVDFVWREQRLIVETDGYQSHRGRVTFEADRERDSELRARGWNVLRFTNTKVSNEWPWVERIVRSLLLRC